MKNRVKLASLLALMALSSNAAAGEFFIGGNIGQSDASSGVDELCDEVREDNQSPSLPVSCFAIEDSDNTLSVNVGYNFNRFLGVEAGYMDFGTYELGLGVSRIIFDVEADLSAVYGALVLSLPVSDKFSLSARVGGAEGTLELDAGILEETFEDEIGAFVGASIDYRVTDNIGLQIRYDDFEIVNVASAGLRFMF